MGKAYDVVVVGLGAVGSAAIYQLSSTGKKVLGIDQFEPPHTLGSSHGDTRITRQAIGEGSYYVPIVLRSNEIWREIESKVNLDLYNPCGGLIFGENPCNTPSHGSTGFLDETINAAKKFNIKHQILEYKELKNKYPQFVYCGEEVGYYEPDAGFLRPEKCIDSQLKLAQTNGTELLLNTKVLYIESSNDKVTIQTSDRKIEAESVIISAGAWINSLLPESYKKLFQPYRQVLYWFEMGLDFDKFAPDNFPIYIRLGQCEEDMFYGFPAIDGANGGIKVAAEQFIDTCCPDTINRDVSDNEIKKMYEHISRYIRVKENCIKASACVYTVTPDFGFIVDFLPDNPQILIASPCSGHGFKHSAGIGEILKDLVVDGETRFDISHFSFDRFKPE